MNKSLFFKTVTLITAAVFLFSGCSKATITPNFSSISGDLDLTVSGKLVNASYSYSPSNLTLSFNLGSEELSFSSNGKNVTVKYMGLESEAGDNAVKTVSVIRKIFEQVSGKPLDKRNKNGTYEQTLNISGMQCTIGFSKEALPLFINIPALELNGQFKNTTIQQ